MLIPSCLRKSLVNLLSVLCAAAGIGGQSLHHSLPWLWSCWKASHCLFSLHLFLGLMVTVHEQMSVGMFMSHMRACSINTELLGKAATENLHAVISKARGIWKRRGLVSLCQVKTLGKMVLSER